MFPVSCLVHPYKEINELLNFTKHRIVQNISRICHTEKHGFCWNHPPFSGTLSSAALTGWFPGTAETGCCKLSSWSSSSSSTFSTSGGPAVLEETCESGTSACVFTAGTQCSMLKDLNNADGALKAGTLAVSCLGVKVIAGRSAGVVSWKSWRGKKVQQGMQRNSEHCIKNSCG